MTGEEGANMRERTAGLKVGCLFSAAVVVVAAGCALPSGPRNLIRQRNGFVPCNVFMRANPFTSEELVAKTHAGTSTF